MLYVFILIFFYNVFLSFLSQLSHVHRFSLGSSRIWCISSMTVFGIPSLLSQTTTPPINGCMPSVVLMRFMKDRPQFSMPVVRLVHDVHLGHLYGYKRVIEAPLPLWHSAYSVNTVLESSSTDRLNGFASSSLAKGPPHPPRRTCEHRRVNTQRHMYYQLEFRPVHVVVGQMKSSILGLIAKAPPGGSVVQYPTMAGAKSWGVWGGGASNFLARHFPPKFGRGGLL